MDKYRFTVLTPTYNRSDLLQRVYECLLDQTYKDFEWLIIDDGSTDDTESVCKEMINQGVLDIRYIKKINGGKHSAYRTAENNYNGTYVVCADDDDLMPSNTLEIFNKYWVQLEDSKDYSDFWEVKGRCVDRNGDMIGRPLPTPVFDSDYNEITYKHHYKEEMHGCNKAEVLRNEAKVPETFMYSDKCSYYYEDIRWSRAAAKYKTRFIDDIVRTYTTDAETSIMRPTNKNRYNGLVAALSRVNERRDLIIKWEIKSHFMNLLVILYSCFALSLNPFNQPIKYKLVDKVVMIILYIPTFVLYIIRR